MLLFLFLCLSCSRPLYIKDRHFDCPPIEYVMDTDLKELVYRTIDRAYVTEREIPDYIFLWKKHRIFISNEYQAKKTRYRPKADWEEPLLFLNPSDLPNFVGSVAFCLKSKKELQKIADRTYEDFLYASFSLIEIEGDTARVRIDNTWITSKHSKLKHGGGGSLMSTFKKVRGVWQSVGKIISGMS